MVRVNVSLTAASPRETDRLVEAFRFLMVKTRVVPGCLECGVWIESGTIVHYAETWATEDDLRQRVCSSTFTSLLSVVEEGTNVSVQFDFVTEQRGLDYVAEVRARTHDAS